MDDGCKLQIWFKIATKLLHGYYRQPVETRQQYDRRLPTTYGLAIIHALQTSPDRQTDER